MKPGRDLVAAYDQIVRQDKRMRRAPLQGPFLHLQNRNERVLAGDLAQ